MKDILSKKERDTIRRLLVWDGLRRTSEWALYNVALLLAGALFIGSAVLTLSRLDDHTILTVLVPGFVMGLLLVGLHAVGLKRIQERHELASIIRKLERTA